MTWACPLLTGAVPMLPPPIENTTVPLTGELPFWLETIVAVNVTLWPSMIEGAEDVRVVVVDLTMLTLTAADVDDE